MPVPELRQQVAHGLDDLLRAQLFHVEFVLWIFSGIRNWSEYREKQG
jgi:hypothetical protein